MEFPLFRMNETTLFLYPVKQHRYVGVRSLIRVFVTAAIHGDCWRGAEDFAAADVLINRFVERVTFTESTRVSFSTCNPPLPSHQRFNSVASYPVDLRAAHYRSGRRID